MVAYLLFFGGMSCFVTAGVTHSPLAGVIGVALAILAFGCGNRVHTQVEPLVFRTHVPILAKRPHPCAATLVTHHHTKYSAHQLHRLRRYARSRA